MEIRPQILRSWGIERGVMNIYELDQTLDWLESMELDEETERDTLESIIDEVGIGKVLDNIAWANANDKAMMKAIKEQRASLADKSISAGGRIDRRNAMALKVLSRLESKKIKTDLYNVWIQNNPVKIEYDESAIPERFFKQVKQLDKDAIKQALKDGKVIEGVTQSQTEGVRFR